MRAMSEVLKPELTFTETKLPTVRVARLGVPGQPTQNWSIDILRPMTFRNGNGETITENTWFPIDLASGAALQELTGAVLAMIEPATKEELLAAQAATANF